MPASGQVERQFTAPEILGAWPQAKKHTQWPGQGEKKGRRGDPIFDAFYSTQVQGLRSGGVETQTLVRSAGTALLDKIGPAILVTHSQAGPFGCCWPIAVRKRSRRLSRSNQADRLFVITSLIWK